MPTFYSEEIYIEPEDYLDACNRWDIDKLIKCLIEDGHIKDPYVEHKDNISMNEKSFNESLDKISANYVMLTLEEEEFINNLAKRL